MKALMFYEPSPEGLAKMMEHAPAHRARQDEFHQRGLLLMSGPYGSPPVGALGVFTTREAAEAFAKDDPFVLHGIVARFHIHDWHEVFA